ncbi:DsrH/TusB family sulfur relay protein [Natrinema gelatinilyticum]|uniref:DsrH/TusB family sulfur relay protein n=1 Tax=Natrinema gelatinilyticum TaxID=2961571 RepID=UPI0020C33EB9|nr:DsrH/TusB family sulfur relay protein [Natrinema gelatinilyticum]
MAEIGLRTAANDTDGIVVLIQDGVLLDPELDMQTLAVERDVKMRGLSLPDRIDTVTYDELVSLMIDHEVTSFV